MAKREVALIYDPIVGTAAAATRLDGLKGASSAALHRDVAEIH